MQPVDQAAYEATTAHVRSQLDEQAFASALEEGRSIPEESLLAFAFADVVHA